MFQRAITFLLIGAILLSVATLISVGLATLLASGGDQGAALAARWAAGILGAMTVLDLIALLLAVAAAVAGPLQPTEPPTPLARPRDATTHEADQTEDTP